MSVWRGEECGSGNQISLEIVCVCVFGGGGVSQDWFSGNPLDLCSNLSPPLSSPSRSLFQESSSPDPLPSELHSPPSHPCSCTPTWTRISSLSNVSPDHLIGLRYWHALHSTNQACHWCRWYPTIYIWSVISQLTQLGPYHVETLNTKLWQKQKSVHQNKKKV